MVERERVACRPIGRERDGSPCIGIFPAVTTPSEVSSPCEPRGPIDRKLELRSAAIRPFHIRRIEITHTADVSRSNELVVIIHEIEVETYIKTQETFCCHAVVTPDGIWHEPSEVGWFGCTDGDPADELEWDLHFKERFIDTAEFDWVATVVDCHI